MLMKRIYKNRWLDFGFEFSFQPFSEGCMQSMVALQAKNNIVFESSATAGSKSRFAVYSVRSDCWTDQYASDMACLSPDDTLILSEQNLKFLTDSASEPVVWDELIQKSGAEIDDATIYNAIAVLCITTRTGNARKAVVVLVPKRSGELAYVEVVFVPMKQLDGYTKGNTRYKAFKKERCDESLGKELFSGCKLCFFHRGNILRTPFAAGTQGKHRKNHWRRAVGSSEVSTGANQYLAFRRPAPQNVRLALPVVTRLCRKLEEGQELTVKVRYGGGKMHAPLRVPLEARNLRESLDAKYRVVSRPPADYTICVENWSTVNPTAYFARPLSASTIVSAVNTLRDEAMAKLSKADVDDVLGALASCLYEDIGWKLDRTLPLEDARISKLLVDVDQVSVAESNVV
jgi:hypothetical protein